MKKKVKYSSTYFIKKKLKGDYYLEVKN